MVDYFKTLNDYQFEKQRNDNKIMTINNILDFIFYFICKIIDEELDESFESIFKLPIISKYCSFIFFIL